MAINDARSGSSIALINASAGERESVALTVQSVLPTPRPRRRAGSARSPAPTLDAPDVLAHQAEDRQLVADRYLKRYIPLPVHTDRGIHRHASLRKRISDSRLNKLRHSLPPLDSGNFRSPVHLDIKR